MQESVCLCGGESCSQRAGGLRCQVQPAALRPERAMAPQSGLPASSLARRPGPLSCTPAAAGVHQEGQAGRRAGGEVVPAVCGQREPDAVAQHRLLPHTGEYGRSGRRRRLSFLVWGMPGPRRHPSLASLRLGHLVIATSPRFSPSRRPRSCPSATGACADYASPSRCTDARWGMPRWPQPSPASSPRPRGLPPRAT